MEVSGAVALVLLEGLLDEATELLGPVVSGEVELLVLDGVELAVVDELG